MIIAVVMAGGKGKRMKTILEKPLLKFKSKPLICHVLNNLNNSKYIEKIVIAVSPHTPKTKEFLIKKNSNSDFYKKNTSYEIIETPGNGYLKDLSFLLSKFENDSKNNVLVIINSDLPFIFSDIIDYVIESYFKSEKQAMSISVSISIFNKFNINPSFVFKDKVPSGLNILISQNIVQSEEELIIPKIELALNINTLEDLEIANKIFK